ncbi:MAG TPA: CotH kinase family protein [Pseudobacteroides sp.]|nr:CotH kinase family protein [Pseudobacteroides sp.]
MYYRRVSKFIVSFLITVAMCINMFYVSFAANKKTPEVIFEISNVTPKLNEVVTFDASASKAAEGEIVSYEWDFEDGYYANGPIITHSFNKKNDYYVILTIKDSHGNMGFKKQKIFVGRPQGWTEETHSKNADPDYNLLFPDDKVLRIDIKMNRDDYQKIKTSVTDSEDTVYVPVTVSFNGITWCSVGFKYNENGSLTALEDKTKLPFRLDFDKFEDENPEIMDQRFWGFSSMIFDNCWNDYSFMREKIAGEIFREGGVPAAKSSFCRVYADTGDGPKYWGLYTMIEDPSDVMLRDQFGNTEGNCYKPEGPGADWSLPFDEEAFIKVNNEEDEDWSDVEIAHEALFDENTDKEVWRSNLEKYFNVKGFIKWLAINTAIVNLDSYGTSAHNYYLYNDKDKGLTWIPWNHNLSLTKGTLDKVLSLSLKEVTDKWPLIRKLLDDPVYNNLYHYEMWLALKGCLNADKISSKILSYQALIKPYVVGEEGETDEAAFNSACDAVIKHIIARQREVSDYLKTVTITAPVPKVDFNKVDLNFDGIINIEDIVIIAKAFNTAKGYEKYNAACDFNEDNCVNLLDIIVIAKMFGKTMND